MVQKKAQKSKPTSKAYSKTRDGTELNAQLGALGLRIVHITADGNCLFRAAADQLEGDEEEHPKYRKMVVDYIEAHREEYEPFLEDDIPFDDYCKNMRETSTWAGHMELQVMSLVTRTNICIHRALSPRWQIQNFRSVNARCLHLSYHNGEHYNSIRRKDDNGDGPAKFVVLETPGMEDKSGKSKASREKHPSKVSGQAHSKVLHTNQCVDNGWSFMDHNENGDDDIERELQSESLISGEAEEVQNLSHVDDLQEEPSLQTALPSNGGDAPNKRPLEKDKKISRNKACPCGSKKKYKACCGTVIAHRNAQDVECTTAALSNKSRKQKLRNTKLSLKAEPEPEPEPEPASSKDSLDMGYLCI